MSGSFWVGKNEVRDNKLFPSEEVEDVEEDKRGAEDVEELNEGEVVEPPDEGYSPNG